MTTEEILQWIDAEIQRCDAMYEKAQRKWDFNTDRYHLGRAEALEDLKEFISAHDH